MERKNDSTILLLVAAGLGIYWYMKNKPKPNTTVDVISTQPVLDQPIVAVPTQDEIIVPKDNLKTTVIEEYTPVTDMFNNTLYMVNYVEKNPMESVYNMNVAPVE
jgi:hypothetical protein